MGEGEGEWGINVTYEVFGVYPAIGVGGELFFVASDFFALFNSAFQHPDEGFGDEALAVLH